MSAPVGKLILWTPAVALIAALIAAAVALSAAKRAVRGLTHWPEQCAPRH